VAATKFQHWLTSPLLTMRCRLRSQTLFRADRISFNTNIWLRLSWFAMRTFVKFLFLICDFVSRGWHAWEMRVSQLNRPVCCCWRRGQRQNPFGPFEIAQIQHSPAYSDKPSASNDSSRHLIYFASSTATSNIWECVIDRSPSSLPQRIPSWDKSEVDVTICHRWHISLRSIVMPKDSCGLGT
jgi:hypothetical protein